jgi:hypothetical protein
MPSSPRRRIPLASVADELTARIARLGFANLRQLDASHGRQDHTVLPYAASTAKNFNQPSAGQPKIWRRRLSAVRLRAMFAHGKPALRTPFAPDAAASTATRPNVRDDGQRPSSRGRDGGSCRGDLGSRRSGIFLWAGVDGANQLEIAAGNRTIAQPMGIASLHSSYELRLLHRTPRCANGGAARIYAELPRLAIHL